MKVCASCKQEKPFSDFYPRRQRKANPYQPWCKSCHSSRVRMQNSPEIVRDRHLRRNYGITMNQYLVMLEAQDNSCAICGTKDPNGYGTFHVDHCHKTGKVRGLLCSGCNIGIGHMKDDAEIVRKAYLYLTE